MASGTRICNGSLHPTRVGPSLLLAAETEAHDARSVIAMANKTPRKRARSAETDRSEVNLLSGGNPQIAKADGDAPVQAYIAAMPDWKSDIGRRLDDLIVRTVPDVRKAVRWNSPFYGVDGQGWFLSYHVFTRYVKVTFLNGSSLDPLPPVESKDSDTRYYHIYEDGAIDEDLVAIWIQQASAIPGWKGFDIL